MNERDANEDLSAFVDGELQGPARNRVVDALYGSSDLRRAWGRLHLIGDAARKIAPVPGADSIAGNVSAILAAEQLVHLRPRPPRSGLRPLAGLAIAAAIAAIAILGIHSLDDGGAESRSVAGVSHPETLVAGPASTASDSPVPRIAAMAPPPAGPGPSRAQWSDVAPDAEARLNAYLVNHHVYANDGMRGVLPYVRIVAYQPSAGDYR